MSLKQLIYVSSARTELDTAELDVILEAAARRNSPASVTGMLLYCSGSFMQVLEGEAAAVSEVYARVERDPRHHSIIVLVDDPITERSFDGWSMGFRRISSADLAQHPAYAPLVANGFDAVALGIRPGVALDILKDFSRR